MKVRIATFLILLLTFNSCSDENYYLHGEDNFFGSSFSEFRDIKISKAKITGLDLTRCTCCGGYFIEIENSTYVFHDWELPGVHSRLNLEELWGDFPIDVTIAWRQKEEECSPSELIQIYKISVNQ